MDAEWSGFASYLYDSSIRIASIEAEMFRFYANKMKRVRDTVPVAHRNHRTGLEEGVAAGLYLSANLQPVGVAPYERRRKTPKLSISRDAIVA